MKKIIKYVLLILFFSIAILFCNQQQIEASASLYTVTINGQELNKDYKYLVNGVRSESGVLGYNDCTAEFDAETGLLTLNKYNGGAIKKRWRRKFNNKTHR